MTAESIASKLWNQCNVLRDDGVTYHQYLNELTYILFLKLSEIKGFETEIPEEYRWKIFVTEKDNSKAFALYRDFLANVSTKTTSNSIKEIYRDASTSLRKPVNFNTIVQAIDKLDWYEEDDRDMMGDIYESLLEKNATEKKSGAGQYFTPRPLINVMVKLSVPTIGERWNDPAAGTFGFMIAANQYLRGKHDNYFDLNTQERKFQKEEAFSGVELVPDAHRLALMNARLHDMESTIHLGDTLSKLGKELKNFDGVLANPPFGTKKGGELPNRDDFTYPTSNKQLNFLQHIYRSLKKDGKARAAVVLPDNVLFADGDGERIRRDLMEKCNLHTILRLPTGIFYAQGVKTNVLFFTRGKTDKGNTKEVWIYDLRSDMPSFGKTNQLKTEHFAEFVECYKGCDLNARTETYSSENPNGRWRKFTYEEVLSRDKTSLDITWMKSDSGTDDYTLAELLDQIKEKSANIAKAVAALEALIGEVDE